VELSLDVIETIELTVVCHVAGAVPQGYNSLEPVVAPAVVTVTGPRRVLSMIAEAVVSLELAGRTDDFTVELPFVLLDQNGLEFLSDQIQLSNEEAAVHVSISETLSSKSVSVRTALSGNVDGRYIVAGVEVQPSTVKITGSYAVVSPIEFLTTETIDLSPLTETFHNQVRLITPPGISVLEGDQVELIVRIEKNLIRRFIEGITIEIRNAPEDADYEIEPATITVTLAAFPDVFESAMVDGVLMIDARAYIDLEGQPAEDREYLVMLEVPEDYLVSQVSHETTRPRIILEDEE